MHHHCITSATQSVVAGPPRSSSHGHGTMRRREGRVSAPPECVWLALLSFVTYYASFPLFTPQDKGWQHMLYASGGKSQSRGHTVSLQRLVSVPSPSGVSHESGSACKQRCEHYKHCAAVHGCRAGEPHELKHSISINLQLNTASHANKLWTLSFSSRIDYYPICCQSFESKSS